MCFFVIESREYNNNNRNVALNTLNYNNRINEFNNNIYNTSIILSFNNNNNIIKIYFYWDG